MTSVSNFFHKIKYTFFGKLIVVFIAGSLSAYSFAPHKHLWILFIAYPFFFKILNQIRSKKSAFAIGWCFGFGQFIFGLYWISNAFLTKSVDLIWLVPIGIIGFPFVLAFVTGFFALLFFYIKHKFNILNLFQQILLFSLLWFIFELIRGHLFTGFPWNLLGYVWWDWLPILQVSAYIGTYGLSFLTVFLVTLPVILIENLNWKKKLIATAAAIFSFCLVWYLGFTRIEYYKDFYKEDAFVPGVVLRLVQGNIGQDFKWAPHLASTHLRTYIDLSIQEGWEKVTHIIWPETAIPFVLNKDENCRLALGRIVPPSGALIAGGVRYETEPERKVWNSLYVLDHQANIVAFYDKSHLVPFGEYIPFKKYVPLRKLVEGPLDYSFGKGVSTLAFTGIPSFSPLICYEVIFPGKVVDQKTHPQWLLNLTNDAWYGHSAGPYQHLHISRVRAIEEGIPLIRVANTGITAVIDPTGSILKTIPYGECGVIDTNLPKVFPQKTFFAFLGYWIYLFFLPLFLFFVSIKRFGKKN